MNIDNSLFFKEIKLNTPEHRLWAKVLIRAYNDILKPEHRRESLNWFTNKNSGLEEICDVLGLNVDVARKKAIEVARKGYSQRLKILFKNINKE